MKEIKLVVGGLYRFIRKEPANLFNSPGRCLNYKDIFCVVAVEEYSDMISYNILGANTTQTGVISFIKNSAWGWQDARTVDGWPDDNDLFEKIV